MVVPTGNEGSDGPQHTSPLPPVAAAGERHGGPRPPGGTPDRQLDGAWRVWERLRDFDRRYATAVDVAIAVVLFVLCSGWFIDAGGHTARACGSWPP